MSPFLREKKTLRDNKLAIQKWMLSTSFRFVLLSLLVVFGIMYVVQTSSASTKGFEMNDIKKQITSLERENQELQYKIANYRSMQSIKERLKGMDLVVATDVQYVKTVGTAVAMR